MAAVLKFSRSSTNLVLNNPKGTPGIAVMDWSPKIATPLPNRIPAPIIESMQFRVEGSSHDNLATHMRNLAAMQGHATRYIQDRTETYPVMLVAQMENATAARQCLVRRIDVAYASPWYGPVAEHNVMTGTMLVEREPYWEATSTQTLAYLADTTGLPVVWDYTSGTADLLGDVAGHIGYVLLVAPAGGEDIGRMWLGLRSANKHGTLANFVSNWECEAGVFPVLGGEAAQVADDTASGSSMVKITPADATWKKRLSMQLNLTTANYADQTGTFTYLLRARCSVASTTWDIQLRHGYAGWDSDYYVRGPIVSYSKAWWDLVDLGTGDVPVTAIRGVDASRIASHQLEVWARRRSGTGELDLDCMALIPVDEGSMVIRNAALSPGASEDAYFVLATMPENTHIATTESHERGSLTGVPEIDADHFFLPPGDGRMYLACASADHHNIGTTQLRIGAAAVGGTFYPRYLSL
jgi:hypothetical protein